MVPPPEITYFVGISHDTDHYSLEKELNGWSSNEKMVVVPAFDGLRICL
jgi:hypothetical protein